MYDVDNSMITTSIYDIREGKRKGRVQLKWVKDNAAIIIKNIILTPFGGNDNKYIINTATNTMLFMYPTINFIIIECPRPAFAVKYECLGWFYDRQLNHLYKEHSY
jgi:hypothetical protein